MTLVDLKTTPIEYVTENPKVKHIYFEGNINSYTYADEGASLYDVLHLYNEQHRLIKDKLISSMKNLDELEEYVEKTEDKQLGMMIQIVREYGNEIPAILRSIKNKHIPNDAKEKAAVIFSTVHRSKGMEYDHVRIVNDFITEDKLRNIINGSKDKELPIAKLNEEINLLYVAVTRTRNSMQIPEELLPADFIECPGIEVIAAEEEEIEPTQKTQTASAKKTKTSAAKEKTYDKEALRTTHKEAYKPWTSQMDDELVIMYGDGIGMSELASEFGRTKGAVWARIRKLELEDMNEHY